MGTQTTVVVGDLAGRFGPAVPPGPWPDPPREAVVVPIKSNGAQRLAGVLVAGVSARSKLDDLYLSFYALVASQIGAAVSNARAYEEEKERAEDLLEIDRVKTQFFSNVSHEFRTPLTLMLGPIEDLLRSRFGELSTANRSHLEIAHRNSLRLLKLVNTMLDFSRIEAGRMQANYEETDLAAYTGELASNFRSACERAGLSLTIICPPSPPDAAPAYVDRDMWEKIVLNLLSNAFKFTLQGGIDVRLTAAGATAELVVHDTGVGIPGDELPHLFERFHRVTETRGRSHEGTGIGLAMVRELALAARRERARCERARPGQHLYGIDSARPGSSRSGSHPQAERSVPRRNGRPGFCRGGVALASNNGHCRRRRRGARGAQGLGARLGNRRA